VKCPNILVRGRKRKLSYLKLLTVGGGPFSAHSYLSDATPEVLNSCPHIIQENFESVIQSVRNIQMLITDTSSRTELLILLFTSRFNHLRNLDYSLLEKNLSILSQKTPFYISQ
jgi:hypothetical protein